ncbi:TRAF-like [Trinorchestia longiramus]|nr:TRAF-like [Trinorchestia longiramus]
MTYSKTNACQRLLLLAAVLLAAVSAQSRNRINDGFSSMLQEIGGAGGAGGGGTCRISSRELLNTAQATANRILQGVCNPRELDERLILLETRVGEQFNVLKAMVLDLETKLRDQDQQVKRQHRGLHRAIANARKTGDHLEKSPARRRRMDEPMDRFRSHAPDDLEEDETEGNQLSSEQDFADFYNDDLDEFQASPRAAEVSKYNSSIHLEDGQRVFTYYWKVEDIRYRMNNWGWRRSLRSPDFYIFKFGYKMFMKIYPNNNGENIYVHVALTKGEYDASLEWPFTLPLRVGVLDHSRNPDDIAGRVWYPTELCSGLHWQRPANSDNQICVGLGFSHNDLDIANYVYADAITIKLTVFLD